MLRGFSGRHQKGENRFMTELRLVQWNSGGRLGIPKILAEAHKYEIVSIQETKRIYTREYLPNVSLGDLNDYSADSSNSFLLSITRFIAGKDRPHLPALCGKELFKANSIGDTMLAKLWSSLYWPCRARHQLDREKNQIRSLLPYSSQWWHIAAKKFLFRHTAASNWIREVNSKAVTESLCHEHSLGCSGSPLALSFLPIKRRRLYLSYEYIIKYWGSKNKTSSNNASAPFKATNVLSIENIEFIAKAMIHANPQQ
ncbi:hypothetical protein ACOME3_008254 [Neoechinorhynchus agilis]